MRLLDPRIDVVFKLLFAAPRHEALLIAFLTDVLRPPSAIDSVTVLNPEIPKEMVGDKGIILDVRVMLSDGKLLDVEMQARKKPAYRERLLYYWARTFGAQLEIGEDYRSLAPCVGIYVLDFSDLVGQNFRSTFRACNPATGEILSDALELHFLELPKLSAADNNDPAAPWGRFFLVENEQQLQELAMSSPTMKQASDALWWVSQDPNSRQLAEMRDLAHRVHRHTMAAAIKEGRDEGLKEGRDEGLAQGLRHEVETLARVFGVEIDGQRQAQLHSMNRPQLQQLIEILTQSHEWPLGG